MKKFFPLIIFGFVYLLLLAVYLLLGKVLAPSQAHVPTIMFLLSIVNFAFFLYLVPKALAFLMGMPPFADLFKERSASIEKEITEATLEKEKAGQNYDSVRNKLENISAEIDTLSADAKDRGARFKQEILDLAKARSEEIIKDSRLQAEREAEEARSLIKKQIVELSIKLAMEKVAKKMDKSEHSRLIEKSIRELKELQ
jgi:F-type H+-transporting ATPase subunit b